MASTQEHDRKEMASYIARKLAVITDDVSVDDIVVEDKYSYPLQWEETLIKVNQFRTFCMRNSTDRCLDRFMRFNITGKDDGKCRISMKAYDVKRSLIPSPVSLTVREFGAGVVHGRIPCSTMSSFMHQQTMCYAPWNGIFWEVRSAEPMPLYDFA